MDDENSSQCDRPCPADDPCEECADYWNRMRKEGFWKDGVGWTNKALREMFK